MLVAIAEFERELIEKRTGDTGKKGIAKLAWEHGSLQFADPAILDRFLPSLTPVAQVLELRRLLFDLEELREAYHGIAMAENDAEAADVSIRTAHEFRSECSLVAVSTALQSSSRSRSVRARERHRWQRFSVDSNISVGNQ